MRQKVGWVGLAAVILVGVVLILAGSLKLLGAGAEDMIQGLEKANLIQYRVPISVLSIVCGVLLLAPQTRKLGILMASAYWGGAIVAHMTYQDSIVMPAMFQGTLWAGVGLVEWSSRTQEPPLA